jgi:hypothetical protein
MGFPDTKIEHVTQGSKSLTGTFTLSLLGADNTIELAFDEDPAKLKEKLMALAVIDSEDIIVT